ncbi:HNH endonuclease [Lamprobacter modestohalophilus]|uniref:HNH endonuclease n=1 Tax=Lamprobacter modestohalophilus TaxID=1064514 RepID=A0A9X0W7I4_9GAMM|nr:HNH endonuclease [Lamprobacter modestohalophilus]MBK1618477.1 HNH endonuclease [Lamprobacter modestohalophilus]
MNERDQQIRLTAFHHCGQLLKVHTGAVPWAAIQPGFRFEGEQVFLGSTPRGIHRPAQMQRGILSIKTTKPKQGRTARYDDALGDDGDFSYAFQGTDPGNRDNTALRQAFEDQTPFLYFYGLVPGVYEILFPCYLTDWDAQALRCTVAVGNARELARPTKPADDPVLAMPIDRRYSTVEAKVRLHQAEFRELVLGAYERRCAITGLPVLGLLEAAHIIPDRDERGRPEVSNGLCLSALHHTAYDHNLLGIDPDGKVHIADAVLEQHDGPTLEQAIKGYNGQRIRLPRHLEDRPDREALEVRFGEFLGV